MAKRFILTTILLFLGGNHFLSAHIIEISIPKCGTHLLMKCIQKITGVTDWVFSYGLPNSELFNKENIQIRCHLRHTNRNEIDLHSLGITKKFFIYRDPRDQLISFIFWGNKYQNRQVSENKLHAFIKAIHLLEDAITLPIRKPMYSFYGHLKFDELILQLIFGGSAYYDGLGPYKDGYKTQGIADFYQSYLPWMSMEDICVVRFEDLVGSRGGGDDAIQLMTIKRIADHLEMSLSEKELIKIAFGLFGKNTFREGEIGS